MDKRRFNGGNRNAGRKTKIAEEHANKIFLSALKKLYGKETDEEAKIAFVVKLHNSERGKQFIAEHLFGKAPNQIDFNESNEPRRELELTLNEATAIANVLTEKYN